MSRRIEDFEPVEFKRGEWKSFETYATDFLTNTAALPLAAVGAYARARAALWAYGNGWSLKTTAQAWATHAGAQDAAELEAVLRDLEQRGIVFLVRDGSGLTMIDPAMHADMARKEKRRNRKKTHRERSRETSHGASRETRRAKVRETSRGTSVLPPSSVLLPDSSCSPTSTVPTDVGTASPSVDACPANAGPRLAPAEIDAIFAHYRSYHPQSRPGKKERVLVSARLKEGYSAADLCEAIDGCHRSPFHCGLNDRSTKFQSLELIVRDSKHVAEFIELARAPTSTGPITHRQSAEDAAEARLLARAGLPPKEDSRNGTR